MSFQQGLSGLNAASKSLETIGNNVANSNTIGFKGSRAQFADVFASSLTGAGGTQIGIGTKLALVSQEFTQGNINSSNNSLDIAINGGGFFRLSNNGAVSYSRNGQFQLDKNGFIVNATGSHLTGYTADLRGVLSTGAPADLKIRTDSLAPKSTTAVSAHINLDSRSTVPTITPFDLNEPRSYTSSSSVSVYDSLGNSHVLQSYYVATATPGLWDVYGTCDGVDFTGGAPIGSLQFNTDGSLDETASALPYALSVDLDAVATANGQTNRATSPLTLALGYANSTQYGANFGVNKLTQDGFAAGRLSGFNIGSDGVISGRYTNGESATLGQVVLANFNNPNGLQPLGGNAWGESSVSGAALIGPPDSGNMGVLQSSAVEESNVDMTAELVNMITAQRVYQANAQTIKTQDQVLQTLVNLR
jgi:flagellar hook protein FlgE